MPLEPHPRRRPALLVALALAVAPLGASARPTGEAAQDAVVLPESSLSLLLRQREPLKLDPNQVLTLEIKEAELQLRIRARLEALGPEDAGDRAGGRGPSGGSGPPGGRGGPGGPGGRAPRGERGGAPSRSDGGGGDSRAERVRAEFDALDRAAFLGVRRLLRPEQQQQADALLSKRGAAAARAPGGTGTGTGSGTAAGAGRPDPAAPPTSLPARVP